MVRIISHIFIHVLLPSGNPESPRNVAERVIDTEVYENSWGLFINHRKWSLLRIQSE